MLSRCTKKGKDLREKDKSQSGGARFNLIEHSLMRSLPSNPGQRNPGGLWDQAEFCCAVLPNAWYHSHSTQSGICHKLWEEMRGKNAKLHPENNQLLFPYEKAAHDFST